MQQTNSNLFLNVTSSRNGLVSQNSLISRGLIAPYHQQAHDINNMLQNQMTKELYNQFKILEERAVLCMKVKDKALEEVTRKSGEMEIRLRKAVAEAEYWRKVSEQKTDLCKDLATRLLKVKRRENPMRGEKFAEEAQSSTGENGDDDVDTARTRKCKRRRL